MSLSANKKLIATICTLSMLGMTGCVSVNPYTGQQETSNTTVGAGVGAGIGAVAGALLGGQRGALIGGAIGGSTGGLIGHNMDSQNAELRQVLAGTGVQVVNNGNSIQLIMASDVTFATNQSAIEADFYPTLNSVAIVLRKYNNTSINITGFTDNTGSDAYNQNLSEQRAGSVGDYLVSQGISANRIFTTGMGKRYPVASNNTVRGRALNRRVVIILRPL